jgi:hypothetical protein
MDDLTAANKQLLELDTMEQLCGDYNSLNFDQKGIVD